jgi:putative ABC transport system permease protein
MKSRDVLSFSFSAIKLRKLRAGLTILGVVIGIAAIIALLSISQGLQTTITNQVEKGLGANTLVITPGSGGIFGGASGGPLSGGSLIPSAPSSLSGTASAPKLYLNYTNEIQGLSSDIKTVVATVQQSGFIQNGDKVIQISGGIIGVNFSEYVDTYGDTFKAESGAVPLNPSDNDIVIGQRIHDPALNGTIFVDVNNEVNVLRIDTTRLPYTNQSYAARVVAVLPKIGGFQISGPSDNSVYVPIAKARSFFGSDEASSIIVTLKNSDNTTITKVSKLITTYFDNQVTVTSAADISSTISTLSSTLNLFLGGVAAISLFVAGIGIMNIMIVSLIERTREIGILKALGMKSRTVLAIFLGESVIIGLIGAVAGIVLGLVLSNGVAMGFSAGSSGITISPILTPEVALLALGFGVLVSTIFALYPAWRASKLRPVEALRYE